MKKYKNTSSPPRHTPQTCSAIGITISSNPNSSALDEKHGIHVVQMDSTSKRNTEPVHRSPMFTGKNKNKPAGPSGIFNQRSPRKKIMINKENQTGRTGGKTETKTKQEWAKDTFNPEMGCDSFHRDYVSVIISFDPPVHTTEHGEEVNS